MRKTYIPSMKAIAFRLQSWRYLILFFFAAGLIGASVSYYSHEEVVQEFYNPVLEKLPVHAQFEYGLALFLGE